MSLSQDNKPTETDKPSHPVTLDSVQSKGSEVLGSITNTLKEKVGGFLEQAGKTIQNTANIVVGTVATLAENPGGLLKAVKEGFSNAYNDLQADVGEKFNSLKSTIGENYEKVAQQVRSNYDNLLDTSTKAIKTSVDNIKESVNQGKEFIKEQVTHTKTEIQDGIQFYKNASVNAVLQMQNEIGVVFPNTTDIINRDKKLLPEQLKTVQRLYKEELKTILDNSKTSILNLENNKDSIVSEIGSEAYNSMRRNIQLGVAEKLAELRGDVASVVHDTATSNSEVDRVKFEAKRKGEDVYIPSKATPDNIEESFQQHRNKYTHNLPDWAQNIMKR